MDDRDVYYIKVCLHSMSSHSRMNTYIKASEKKGSENTHIEKQFCDQSIREITGSSYYIFLR